MVPAELATGRPIANQESEATTGTNTIARIHTASAVLLIIILLRATEIRASAARPTATRPAAKKTQSMIAGVIGLTDSAA